MEAKLMLGNGEQLLLAVVIPVIVLIGGVRGADRIGLDFTRPAVDVLTPGVLALAVMSTAFTSLGHRHRLRAPLRRHQAPRLLPLTRTDLLVGKVSALLLVEALQIAVITPVGLVLGWDPDVSVVGAVLAVVAGTAAFAALGLALAGSLRAEATLAAANLVYLLLLAGGAVVLPMSAYGDFGDVVRWLPSGALGNAMREALGDATVAWRELAVLAGWAVAGAGLTARTFKWE